MVFMLLSLLSVPASEALLFVSIVLNDGAPQPLYLRSLHPVKQNVILNADMV